jgi:hypothetical protein
LQICFGESAMGSMIQAGYAPVIAFAQGFHGPLHDLDSYEGYEKAFQGFLEGMHHYIGREDITHWIEALGSIPLFSYRDGTSPSTPLPSSEFIRLMNVHDKVIVWVSLGFHENLLLAFLIRLFTLYSLPIEKIMVKRSETQIINGKAEDVISWGVISPQGMKESPLPKTLDHDEIELLIKGWEAITSTNPASIEAYLAIPHTTQFQRGFRDFQKRRPSSNSGLTRCQTELLEAYPLETPSVKANFLIGTVMGNQKHLDRMNDLDLYWNLASLTDLHAQRPAFISTDADTREHRVALTEYGRLLRDGKANWQEDNPVDYYVGGLHIHSTPTSSQG